MALKVGKIEAAKINIVRIKTETMAEDIRRRRSQNETEANRDKEAHEERKQESGE